MKTLILINLFFLITVLFFIVAEQKYIISIKRFKEHNVINYPGLPKVLADGLKLFVKEITLPSNSNNVIFLIVFIIVYLLGLVGVVIPFYSHIVLTDFNFLDFSFLLV